MQLYFAGILHDDPAMVAPLRRWLLDLKETHDVAPAFVAVEWYPGVLDAYCEAWDDFYKLATRDWSCQDDAVARTMADSIAYEATVAADVFGPGAIWWMNEPPQYLPLGKDAYTVHWSRLHPRGEHKTCPSIAKLSILARLVADGVGRNVPRDLYLEQRLLEARESRPGSWAVAVTGALHASDCWTDTTRSLVGSKGFSCEPSMFFGWRPRCPTKG